MPVERTPALALGAPHRFPPRRSQLRAIVWSSEEFRVAAEALPEMLKHADAPERLRPRLRLGEADLCQAACLPDEMRGIALWFEDRYRAHLPPVALLHLDRFLEIWRFIDLHGEALKRERRITTHVTDGTRVADDLLAALVAIDYTPSFLGRSEDCGIGTYDAVLALTRAIASGRVQVHPFERKIPPAGSEHDPILWDVVIRRTGESGREAERGGPTVMN